MLMALEKCNIYATFCNEHEPCTCINKKTYRQQEIHKHSQPCLQVERRVRTAGSAGESRWRQASAPDAGGSRHRPNSAPPGPGLAAHVAVTPPPPAGSHTAVGPQPATGHSKG